MKPCYDSVIENGNVKGGVFMVSHADMPMPEGYAQGFSDIEDGKLKTKPDAPAWAVKEAKQFNKTLLDAKKEGVKV